MLDLLYEIEKTAAKINTLQDGKHKCIKLYEEYDGKGNRRAVDRCH